MSGVIAFGCGCQTGLLLGKRSHKLLLICRALALGQTRTMASRRNRRITHRPTSFTDGTANTLKFSEGRLYNNLCQSFVIQQIICLFTVEQQICSIHNSFYKIPAIICMMTLSKCAILPIWMLIGGHLYIFLSSFKPLDHFDHYLIWFMCNANKFRIFQEK